MHTLFDLTAAVSVGLGKAILIKGSVLSKAKFIDLHLHYQGTAMCYEDNNSLLNSDSIYIWSWLLAR